MLYIYILYTHIYIYIYIYYICAIYTIYIHTYIYITISHQKKSISTNQQLILCRIRTYLFKSACTLANGCSSVIIATIFCEE